MARSFTIPWEFDWILLGSALLLTIAGLITMGSFHINGSGVIMRQTIFALVGLAMMAATSFLDVSFFKRSSVVLALYGLGCVTLMALFVFGSTIKGATSWFSLGAFSLQPADPMKLILIIVLAKYLSRRHIEIARIKHLIISGLYFLIPFALILIQPDFGSSLIFIAIWFGMLLVSGLSRKQLLVLTALALMGVTILWVGVFKPYQKARILTFLHPAQDISGTGYNSYQSMIAVGSGRVLGKGVGSGSQARLQFLPEHQTDFIFASFAEEWGFIGSLLIYLLLGTIIIRGIIIAKYASSGFDSLLALGIVFYLTAHVIINIGMNIGLLPITGVTLPFMSYGGSHLLTEFIALGLLTSIERFRTRAAPVYEVQHEFLGYRS
jgi:rod shape determining protein RodA